LNYASASIRQLTAAQEQDMSDKRDVKEQIWKILEDDVSDESNLNRRGDSAKLEEARQLLTSQQKVGGLEVAKW
jgi:hypothetical protein